MFSSHNDPQLGIAAECWNYTFSYEILKWFVNHHINTTVLISNFFQLQIELYCEKFLCIHLQVKTDFDYIHIQLYFTLFFSKVEWNQLITINTVNLLLKLFHFQRLMLSEYIEINFYFRFRVFSWLLLFVWFCKEKLCI